MRRCSRSTSRRVVIGSDLAAVLAALWGLTMALLVVVIATLLRTGKILAHTNQVITESRALTAAMAGLRGDQELLVRGAVTKIETKIETALSPPAQSVPVPPSIWKADFTEVPTTTRQDAKSSSSSGSGTRRTQTLISQGSIGPAEDDLDTRMITQDQRDAARGEGLGGAR